MIITLQKLGILDYYMYIIKSIIIAACSREVVYDYSIRNVGSCSAKPPNLIPHNTVWYYGHTVWL